MRFGNTVGPFLDRVPATPARFDFVEPTLGATGIALPDVDVDAVREALAEAGVDLTVHLPTDLPLVQAPPEVADGHLAYLDRALSVAADLGAEKGVAHCTAGRGARDDPDALRETVARLAAAGDDHDVAVVFENLGQFEKGYDLDVVGDVLADGDAGMCFDVGHAFEEGGQAAVEDFLGSYADIVSHLHVHDVRARGDSHIPVGAGEIDYDRVGAALGAAGFDGTVAVEVFAPDESLSVHSADRVAAAFDR